MKKLCIYLPLAILATLFFSCVKDDDGTGSGGDPPLSYNLSFYFSDSLGNNLLPYDLPENPIVDPESFYAYSDREDNIGRYIRTEANGYTFEMSELMYNIHTDTTGWQQDSIIYFYPCFGQVCDTVEIYKTDIGTGTRFNDDWPHCSAQWIIYQSDTLEMPYCRIIPVVTN